MVLPSTNLLRITQCILIFAISGSLWSVTPASMSTTPTKKIEYQLGIKITNRVFNDSLLNPNSEDYKKLYGEVSQLLANVYKCPTCGTASIYEGIATMTFRKGSVIANTILVFNTNAINGFVVKWKFLTHIEANPSASLQIDTNYIECSLSVPFSVTPAGMRTTPTTKTVFQLGMKITNRVFNDSLLNPNSEDYKKMYDDVSQLPTPRLAPRQVPLLCRLQHLRWQLLLLSLIPTR
ncbi:uncharacterized protein isoform X2 [Salmo salar]|uniref:Mucin-1 n=1 Tax=Salmo salar TaxID=8030 RepID=A0A1S3PZR5_SALSA|nr:uncharacterized protein LOC106588563 isoform X2 [Salmo salar]|eukprot:XP_014033172.1 PREDICTED: uncharacterized protein LOC106588563 isoform X2 [Salmo salar]